MATRQIAVPPKLGIKLSYLAEQLDCSSAVLLDNIKRDPSHRLYLKAFKIASREYRVNWEDAVDFIERNFVGAVVDVKS